VQLLNKITKFCLVLVLVAALVVLGVYGYNRVHREIDYRRHPLHFSEYVMEAARDHDIAPERIFAVILAESGFNPQAVSRAGARGLMQIMPSTFTWLVELRGMNYTEEDLFNPRINIDFGAYYLRRQYNTLGNWDHAHMAYNAGIGTVQGWLRNENIAPDGVIIHNQIPFGETRRYIYKVNNAIREYRRLYFMDS